MVSCENSLAEVTSVGQQLGSEEATGEGQLSVSHVLRLWF